MARFFEISSIPPSRGLSTRSPRVRSPMKKKRLLQILAALALIVSGALMFHPYPRQLVFGPKIKGTPVCAWQEDFRSRNSGGFGDPERETFVAKILDWLNFGDHFLDWNPLSKEEKEAIYITLAADPSPHVRKAIVVELSEMMSKDGIPTYLGFLDDPDLSVAAEACERLYYPESNCLKLPFQN